MNRHFETVMKKNEYFVTSIENMLDAVLQNSETKKTFTAMKKFCIDIPDFNDTQQQKYQSILNGDITKSLSDFVFNAVKLHKIGVFIDSVDFQINFPELNSFNDDLNTFYLRNKIHMQITDIDAVKWFFDFDVDLNKVFLDKIVTTKSNHEEEITFTIGRYSNNITIKKNEENDFMSMIYYKENDSIGFKAHDNSLHAIISEDVLNYDFFRHIHEYTKLDKVNGIFATEEFIFNKGKLNSDIVDIINLKSDYNISEQEKDMFDINSIDSKYKQEKRNFFKRLFKL